jgi:GINS complex subunit 1
MCAFDCLLQPPKELFVEVKVMEDCGEIMTENGPVQLSRGTTHFLRRSDIVHLIRQGKLEHMQSR